MLKPKQSLRGALLNLRSENESRKPRVITLGKAPSGSFWKIGPGLESMLLATRRGISYITLSKSKKDGNYSPRSMFRSLKVYVIDVATEPSSYQTSFSTSPKRFGRLGPFRNLLLRPARIPNKDTISYLPCSQDVSVNKFISYSRLLTPSTQPIGSRTKGPTFSMLVRQCGPWIGVPLLWMICHVCFLRAVGIFGEYLAEGYSDRDYTQYIAVAPFPSHSHSPEIGRRVTRPSQACIQIWSLYSTRPIAEGSSKKKKTEDLGAMKCELVLCLDGGPAHDIKWCPLPTHDKVNRASKLS